jgi:hypothetical protein
VGTRKTFSQSKNSFGFERVCVIDAGLRFDYCAAMAKKKSSKKVKNAFLGNLDRLGGKKLMQRGAEESSRGRESRKHRVGGGGRRSG